MSLVTTIIGVTVLLGGIWIYEHWLSTQRDAAWAQVGNALGLQFHKSFGSATSGQINGELDGVQIDVQTLVKGSGKNKSVYTVVTARVNGRIPLDMKVSREGFLQKAGKLFGTDDIQVGDDELDRQFLITGSNPSTIRRVLTDPAVKASLLTTQKHATSLRVELGEVIIREPDVGKNQEKLTRYIRMSATLAGALGAASAQPALGAASAQAAQGELAAAQAEPAAAQPAAPNLEPAPLPGASDDPNNWW